MDIYNNILTALSNKEKLLAVLIDPDKMELTSLSGFIKNVNKTIATHIFVGGSIVEDYIMDDFVAEIKKHTTLPIIIFPGDVSQITNQANAILFLSLISGRNPEYLIDKQIQAVSKLKDSNLEVIPTGYILIENGKETSVQRVSKTKPLDRNNVQLIADTAKAGEYLGKKLIYLEAGSGAKHAISSEIILKVKQNLNVPLIVGGGIRTKEQLEAAFNSGADLVVIGTAFEDDANFFKQLIKT
ncbi:MAG: geranylgeranylglyceryl/heptaprenylglyceryl phosphate synthase [Flavobacteriaceae bacterium]|nr:geranylgeranylglyceryl/heptaprenylglyceryl phosphate synthase [Flavobacteriaceae bacterium]